MNPSPGITLQYSLTLTALTHTTPQFSPKTLARAWLALYQLGPRWVPPLILPGALANLVLAYQQHHSLQQEEQKRNLYLLAAALTFSILPVTFLYFEPGINGACKWKVEGLLTREEAGLSEGKGKGLVGTSVVRHSGGERAKRWAERSGMAELVEDWVWRNQGRWVVGLVAGVVSFAALVG